MWEFKINYTGLAIAIFLILYSLIFDWVYMANVRYKYQKIDIEGNSNAIKKAKNILNSKNEKVYFKRINHFFQNEINTNKQIIRLPYRTFFNGSIYDYSNAIFAAYKYIYLKKNLKMSKKIIFALRNILSFSIINIIWTLILGLWILVIIFGIIFLISSIIYILITHKSNVASSKFTLEQLKFGENSSTQIFIKKYLKYKKIEGFVTLSILISKTIIGLYQIIMNWGEDE